MTQDNPYQAPASSLSSGAVLPRRWAVIVSTLVVLQLLLAALYASTAFSHLRQGEISPITFLAAVLATVLLAVGVLSYVRKWRYSPYVFGAAALFSGLAALQWRPPFLLTGLAISICAALVSVVATRPKV